MLKYSLNVDRTKINKYIATSIILIFLSSIFLLTALIGSTNGSVYLSKFTFSELVSELLQTKDIKFTLLGYCIDNNCTQQVTHNFDKGKI